MHKETLTEKQMLFCDANGYKCEVTEQDDIVGYALETKGSIPINGLRHNRHGDTSGWYIWCGSVYSEKPDFFAPLHAEHLKERCPEIVELLGLPSGYRFLLAGEYLDIWFDDSLLSV